MKNTAVLSKPTLTAKILTTLIAVACAVALPQIFHFAGEVSGLGGAAMGAAFLPMQIPVILAGFLAGPIVGILAGILSPLVSFGIAGMPAAAMLPFIILELVAYGLVAGLFQKFGKKRTNIFLKLIVVQIVGRLVRTGAVLTAFYVFGNQSVQVSNLWLFVTAAVPGILLQWAIIPLVIYRFKGVKHFD